MTLQELIAQLEAATGPDGNLDIELYKMFGFGKVPTGTIMEYMLDPDVAGLWRCKHAGQENFGSWWHVTYYTNSIDAALTLVPGGWTVGGLCQNDNKRWTCELREGFQTSYSRVVIEPSETLPIAICIAALRARLPTLPRAMRGPLPASWS